MLPVERCQRKTPALGEFKVGGIAGRQVVAVGEPELVSGASSVNRNNGFGECGPLQRLLDFTTLHLLII